MSARLTHVAISAVNPPIMKTFYSGVFGLYPVSEKSAYLTDGYINFAFNKRNPGWQAGLDHFGFEVDDVEEIQRRIRDLYPAVEVTPRPPYRGYVGMASHDPEGQTFDLSYPERGETLRTVSVNERPERTTRYIHHLVKRALDPAKVAQFYQDVFDLQLVKGPGSDRTYHLTDGVVTLVLMPWSIRDYAMTGICERPALDHIGFAVESLAAYQHDLAAFVAEYPEAAPYADSIVRTGVMAERYQAERAAREQLLHQCAYHEMHLWDPECVFFDVCVPDAVAPAHP
jgi:catechol 2,3-dioxygenase-like lactoylglutathione lyase family enzyme